MTAYFLRRLLLVPITFVAITFLVYAILRVVPGGPIEQAVVRMRLAQKGEAGAGSGDTRDGSDLQLSEEALEILTAYYSLDRPIPVGYLQWLGLWPREKRTLVPLVPTKSHAEAYRRLLAATPGNRADVENEVGYYLDEDGRMVQLAFRPLFRLYEARAAARDRLDEITAETGRITWRGSLYRPLTKAEEETHRDLLEKAAALLEKGFAARDDLYELLGTKNLTSRGGAFYAQVPAEGEARELLDLIDLATEKLAEIREKYGLEVSDSGRVYRIESHFSGIFQLDFGQSYMYGEAVLGLIGSKMEVSIQFGLIGYLLAWIVCVPLGVMKAVRHKSAFDTGTSVLVFLGYSIPGYVLCMVLIATVAVNVSWVPIGGYKPDNIEELSFLAALWGRFRHMLIPVAGYTIGSFATMTILMKNSLIENLGQDYVRTAFAKGLSERRVIFVHALRNSLIPITAGIGHAFGLLFAGSFFIEKVCNIDGMGYLGVEALLQRDYPVTMGLLVFYVIIQLFGNILSDVIWALIDPRIRFG